MKKMGLLLLACGLTLSAHAVLAPNYQSVKEFQALVNDPRFAQELSATERVLGIKRVGDGFKVTTTRQTFLVELLYQSQNQPGPQDFILAFPAGK